MAEPRNAGDMEFIGTEKEATDAMLAQLQMLKADPG